LPSIKILTWGVSSFQLGFDFLQKSPKRITPLFLFLHRRSYITIAIKKGFGLGILRFGVIHKKVGPAFKEGT